VQPHYFWRSCSFQTKNKKQKTKNADIYTPVGMLPKLVCGSLLMFLMDNLGSENILRILVRFDVPKGRVDPCASRKELAREFVQYAKEVSWSTQVCIFFIV